MPDTPQRPSPKSYDDLLLVALRRALGPLVGFLLRRGITFPVLSSLIRGLYVEQAEKEFQQGDKRLADSRLSLLTGIARRYVKEIRNSAADEDEKTRSKASSGGKLIAEWLTAPQYLNDEGRPASIPRLSIEGNAEPSFEALVKRVNSDAWPGSVLSSMSEMNLVRVDERDRVHLLTDAYLPSNDSLESLEYFADHLHDHIAVLGRNILGKQAPLIERSAFISGLKASSVEQVQQLSEERVSELLREVYSLAARRHHADRGDATASHRVRFGVYFYTENTEKTTGKAHKEDEKSRHQD